MTRHYYRVVEFGLSRVSYPTYRLRRDLARSADISEVRDGERIIYSA